MKKRARQVVFFVFVAAFFISAPLVVLYTAGYRLNLNNRRVLQTGALAIATTPRGATAVVNNEELNGKTPTVVQRISAGSTTVRLERKGWHSWERQVQVYTGQTSYVTALLFLNSLPILLAPDVAPEPPTTAPQTPDITFIDNGANIEVRAPALIGLLPPATYLTIASNNDVIIVQDNLLRVFVISRDGSATIALSPIATTFDWLKDEGLFVWSDGFEVSMYDTHNQETTFLTRQSTPIQSVLMHPSAEAIIIATAENITALDRDAYHNGRASTELVRLSNISRAWLESSGKTLYIQNAEGTFSVKLQ